MGEARYKIAINVCKCGKTFNARIFNNGRPTSTTCEKCTNAIRMKTIYYPKNKEKILRKGKKWRKLQPKKIKGYYKKYSSKPETKKYKSDWAKRNREKNNESHRKYRRKKSGRAKDKEWRENNISKVRIYQSKDRLRRNGFLQIHTAKEWGKLKKGNNYSCKKCKKKEPKITLSKDHIIPLLLWNKVSHLFKYECDDIRNIQPLCQSCNSRKNKRLSHDELIGIFNRKIINEILKALSTVK